MSLLNLNARAALVISIGLYLLALNLSFGYVVYELNLWSLFKKFDLGESYLSGGSIKPKT